MEECKSHTTIVVNEAFTFANAIFKLQSLPHDEQQCGVFFLVQRKCCPEHDG